MNINFFSNNKILFEDENIIVFMKEKTSANGELILTTKERFDDFSSMNNELICHVHEVLNTMENRIKDKLRPDGLQIINNLGCSNEYGCFYLDILPIYSPKQPLVDLEIIYDKLK